jgi:uncharacterized protein
MANPREVQTWDESQALSADRGTFITRTYAHVFGGILLFTLIEVMIFQSGVAERLAQAMLPMWWLVLLGMMAVSWFASHIAGMSLSRPAQYGAFGVYIVAEALMFAPLLWIANTHAEGAISSAAVITLLGFGALSVIAHKSRQDFSFLRPILMWGGVMAVITIFAAIIFGFELGVLFSGIMVAFAGGAILYDTSNIIRHYPTDRHVSAAMALFGSVMLMFWYVIRLVMASRE